MLKDCKMRAVVCLNDGQVYRSIAAAAADIGVDRSSVQRAMRNDRMISGKFFAEVPPEIETGEQLDKWRVARLLGCISFNIGCGRCDDEGMIEE